jgi:hypothetical protein
MMRFLLPAALVVALLTGSTAARADTTLLCTGEVGWGEVVYTITNGTAFLSYPDRPDIRLVPLKVTETPVSFVVDYGKPGYVVISRVSGRRTVVNPNGSSSPNGSCVPAEAKKF